MSCRIAAASVAAVGASLLGVGLVGAQAAWADYNSGLSTQEQRLYDYGPSGANGTGTGKSGTIFDSANPIDLMNKLRRSTAMDDATDPGDAIDAALKELEPPAPVSSKPLVTAP
ncbi:MAG: hypothetical protein ACO23X_07275 [Vulcanococcus sp.]